jgi:fatty acyl-CoA reductase
MNSSPAVAAFFDVDGTLTKTTVLHPLVWYQQAHLPWWRFALWLAALAVRVPGYVLLDRCSRAAFIHRFYASYAGLPVAEVERFHRQALAGTYAARLYPQAVAKLDWHRRQEHRIILVSGGLDLVLQPLAEHLAADQLLCGRLEVQDGRFTGRLAGPPMIGSHKAQAMLQCPGIDFARSFAYADSISDLPMLQIVGHPAAINPDARLRAVAQRQGWPIHRWR